MNQRLQVCKVAGQVGVAGDKSDAQRGGERLGEGADVNRSVELVERGQARHRGWLEVSQRIVLDDQQIVLLRQLKDAVRLARCKVGAGRVVRHRLGKEQQNSRGL
jgi:hypothetical protein